MATDALLVEVQNLLVDFPNEQQVSMLPSRSLAAADSFSLE